MTFVERILELVNVLVLLTQTHKQKLLPAHVIFDRHAGYQVKLKIKLPLFLQCDVEACNELWSPSPPLSAWAARLLGFALVSLHCG